MEERYIFGYEKEGNNFFRWEVTEKHISLLIEPVGKFIGYFTSVTGRSCSILEDIVKSPKDGRVSMNSLIAIRCDGTNVNTGINGVLIIMMEHYLRDHFTGSLICMLHANEMPLRHLAASLDPSVNFYKTAKRDRLKISLMLKFLQ